MRTSLPVCPAALGFRDVSGIAVEHPSEALCELTMGVGEGRFHKGRNRGRLSARRGIGRVGQVPGGAGTILEKPQQSLAHESGLVEW